VVANALDRARGDTLKRKENGGGRGKWCALHHVLARGKERAAQATLREDHGGGGKLSYIRIRMSTSQKKFIRSGRIKVTRGRKRTREKISIIHAGEGKESRRQMRAQCS